MTETIGLVQQFVERTGQLYSLPAVAAEVLRLTSEPRIDARALKACLERDPALTTRLLRVVNSSLFGLSRQVTDLNQALALLGIRPLKMLVLGFSLPRELFSGLEAGVLGHYWRRTLIKAVAARELAERLWHIPGDEAFIAGLVQDIGQLALIQQLGESYQKLLDHVATHGGNLLHHELETLGFDHVVLSARLLGHWGLPATLCAAVAIPPDEARVSALDASERTLPEILHLADLLARLIDQPYGVALRDLLASGSRYCGLTYEALKPIVAELQQKVEALAEVLALDLPEGKSYVDLLVASQQRLADETFSAAAELALPKAEEQLLALASQMQSDLAAASSGKWIRGRGREAIPLPSGEHGSGADRAPRSASALIGDPGEGGGNLKSQSANPLSLALSRRESATATADPALAARVSAAIHRCRQARCPVALALFEIERFSEILLHLGPVGVTELTHWLRVALADWTGQRSATILVSDSCFALVWEGCPRSEGVRLARHALSAVKPWSRQRLAGGVELILSAGLATLEFPPKNFPPHELIDGAQRCLSGAQLSGGDTVKSIEL
jgi:HD-like signal output (HDOD) protein